jgi:hypothetical protein
MKMTKRLEKEKPLTPSLSPSAGEREKFFGGTLPQGGTSFALGYSSLAPMGLHFEPTHVGCYEGKE